MSFEDIIQLVQARPEIWQFSHPLYHHKELRKRIWRQISKDLHTDEQLIKKRWKHLLDQYRKEFKKMQKQTTYQGEPVPCSWIHYDSLAFLKDEMAMRKERDRNRTNAGSDSDTQYEAAAQDQQEEDEGTNDNYENIIWKYNLAKQNAAKKPLLPETTLSTSASISKADLILRRLQNLSTAISKTCQKDNLKNDEDYLFFMSVLPMVRNLSAVKKLQFRMKVNEWLLQTMTGEADPLNNVGQFLVPVVDNEDNKEDVMKQILGTDGDES